MPSILDNAILVGKETTYGTAASLTRAYEGKADTFKRQQEFLASVGFRGGMQAQLHTRSVPVNMGGEGTIEVDVTPAGYGLLFQSMLGTVAGPSVVTAPARRSTFATNSDGPTDHWTIQTQRVDATGTIRSFTHLGCVMTGWSLSQELDGLLGATFNFDFQDVSTATAAGTPTYTATSDRLPYAWTQCKATWGGADIDLTSWSLDCDLGMKTDRRFLRGNELKKKPVRASVPTFEGTMQMEFESLTQYNAFTAGTVAPLVLTWTGPIIVAAIREELKITIPSVQFQGDSPEVSLDAMPTQPLPYKVLWNPAGTPTAAVTIEYTNQDTTL
jgi:hypothetical protein